MLGFFPISGDAVSALSSLVFYIRGESSIAIVFDTISSGKLDIFGHTVNIVDIGVSSVGFVKINKVKKRIIAMAVQNKINNRAEEKNVSAASSYHNINNRSEKKRINL